MKPFIRLAILGICTFTAVYTAQTPVFAGNGSSGGGRNLHFAPEEILICLEDQGIESNVTLLESTLNTLSDARFEVLVSCLKARQAGSDSI